MIIDNPEHHRYEIRVDDELAGFVQYRRREGLIALIHTEIDTRFEGRGLALSADRGRPGRGARAPACAVFPFCPFVNGYISRHPEYADLVPEEFRAEFGL